MRGKVTSISCDVGGQGVSGFSLCGMEKNHYYGTDQKGNTVDLCEFHYRQYCLLVKMGLIKTPAITCHFCGERHGVNPDVFNDIYQRMDVNNYDPPSFANLPICPKCNSLAGHLYPGPLDIMGVVSSHSVDGVFDRIKKKKDQSKV